MNHPYPHHSFPQGVQAPYRGAPSHAPFQSSGGHDCDQHAYGAAQANDPVPGTFESWFNFHNSGYLKGFVVGAGVALILTNPSVQKALVAGAVKLWSTVQGGVEEVKEQIQDIKAEMSQKD